MSLDSIQAGVIAPALALLPAKMSGSRATVMLLAIGLQESGFTQRCQVNGPAQGLWQFEQGGGVAGVLRYPSTQALAISVCHAEGVTPIPSAVYGALATNDILAAVFARLLLWTDPAPLPALGDAYGAWEVYTRVWRPGALARDPDGLRDRWATSYAAALAQVQQQVTPA